MQIYAPNTIPTFWKQISQLPEGMQNRSNNQAPAVPLFLLFVSFVNRPVGTILQLYLNTVKQADMKVVDATGLVYASLVLPHTRNQDTIELQIKDGGIVLESSSFATSNIDMTFDARSGALRRLEEDAEQLEDDSTIPGVEASLLGGKYGALTGLDRRNDQTLDQYRGQTACLWKSFRYAGTVKGLVDSLKCLLGDITIILEPTRDVIGNRIFDKDQYVPKSDGAGGNVFLPNAGFWDLANKEVKRYDTDIPHYYVADVGLDFRTAYAPGGDPLSLLLIGGPDNTPDGWNATHVQSFTVRTLQAIGNEIFVMIDEADAIRTVIGEQVLRRTGVAKDILANADVASTVIVTNAFTPSTFLPVEGPDFTVDVITGEITWLGTANQPIDGTIYNVNYSFRLDDELIIVIKQVKPAQRSIVVLFSNVTSGLPQALEA